MYSSIRRYSSEQSEFRAVVRLSSAEAKQPLHVRAPETKHRGKNTTSRLSAVVLCVHTPAMGSPDTTFELSISDSSREVAMVAVEVSADEALAQSSASSPETPRRDGREPVRSRSPSRGRDERDAMGLCRPGVDVTRSRRAEEMNVEGGLGAIVLHESEENASSKGKGKAKRTSSSSGTRGRSGQRVARDAAGQLDFPPSAMGVPTRHGAWTRTGERASSAGTRPGNPSALSTQYRPMRNRSKFGCPSPSHGFAARDISCELTRLNSLEQQGKGAAAPVPGVAAKGDESDWNVENELADIMDEDQRAARAAALAYAAYGAVISPPSSMAAAAIVAGSKFAVVALQGHGTGSVDAMPQSAPNGVEFAGYASDIEMVTERDQEQKKT